LVIIACGGGGGGSKAPSVSFEPDNRFPERGETVTVNVSYSEWPGDELLLIYDLEVFEEVTEPIVLPTGDGIGSFELTVRMDAPLGPTTLSASFVRVRDSSFNGLVIQESGGAATLPEISVDMQPQELGIRGTAEATVSIQFEVDEDTVIVLDDLGSGLNGVPDQVTIPADSRSTSFQVDFNSPETQANLRAYFINAARGSDGDARNQPYYSFRTFSSHAGKDLIGTWSGELSGIPIELVFRREIGGDLPRISGLTSTLTIDNSYTGDRGIDQSDDERMHFEIEGARHTFQFLPDYDVASRTWTVRLNCFESSCPGIIPDANNEFTITRQ
jgi:hypothetical protein